MHSIEFKSKNTIFIEILVQGEQLCLGIQL